MTGGTAQRVSRRPRPARKRILVLASPFPTHLMPLISLCWAWRGAGHEVLVVGQPDIKPVVERAGLGCVLIGSAFEELNGRENRPPARPPVRGQQPPDPPWDKLGAVWRERTETMLDPVLDLAQSWRPDLILADPLEFTSLAVGGLVGVPVVQHLWGNDAWSVQVQEPAREQLAALCRGRGLPGGLPVADVVLDPRPPSLATPAWGTPIRSVPFNGVGLVPDWAAEPTRPRRVCLSLGTRHVALNGLSLLRAVAEASAAVPDVEVVLPLAAADRGELGTLPPAVRVVDPCPLNLFLPTCDALVHHGAAGTGMSALVAGVPQLVLPWASFDVFHAEATASSGAGLSLYADEQDDAAVVTAAVARLLEEQSFAVNAQRLADEIAAMPSPADVATDLLATR